MVGGGCHAGLLEGGHWVGWACLRWGWRVEWGPKRKVWDEGQVVPHDVTGRKRSYEDPGSPGQ